MRTVVMLFLLGLSANSQAWWNGPYYPGGGYWPGAWPGYAYGPYNQYGGYGGTDWNVKGYMNEWGDTHFVIEYHGNIYDDMFGGYHGYPGSRGYGLPYPGSPYGGWR